MRFEAGRAEWFASTFPWKPQKRHRETRQIISHDPLNIITSNPMSCGAASNFFFLATNPARLQERHKKRKSICRYFVCISKHSRSGQNQNTPVFSRGLNLLDSDSPKLITIILNITRRLCLQRRLEASLVGWCRFDSKCLRAEWTKLCCASVDCSHWVYADTLPIYVRTGS